MDKAAWLRILESVGDLQAGATADDIDRAEGRLGSGDDGTGAPFCLSLDGTPTVVTWNPIDSQAYPLAPDLATFWPGWAAGTITT